MSVNRRRRSLLRSGFASRQPDRRHRAYAGSVDPLSAAGAAKVGTELVKATGNYLSGIDPAVEKYAEQITGTARGELGSWLADHVRLRRFKSQLKIVGKAQKFAEDAGFDPGVVNLKVLVPLLEAGSLEDDADTDDAERMTDRWAALLANASHANREDEVLPSFPEVLRQLTPVEAKLLDAIYDVAMRFTRKERANHGADGEALRASVGVAEASFSTHIDNLYRLRLAAAPAVGLAFTDNPETRYQLSGYTVICLTDFGNAFVRACRPPGGSSAQASTPPEAFQQTDAKLGSLTYDDLKGEPPQPPPRRVSLDDIDVPSGWGVGS